MLVVVGGVRFVRLRVPSEVVVMLRVRGRGPYQPHGVRKGLAGQVRVIALEAGISRTRPRVVQA